MAEPYRKGEYVRYSCNGVCLVDDIRMDTLGKEAPKEFYILKPVSNPASTIFVPTASQALVDRMARLPNQEELDQLILSTRDKEIPWIEDRKGPSGQLSGHHQNVICGTSSVWPSASTNANGLSPPSAEAPAPPMKPSSHGGLIENQVSFVLQVSTDQVSGYIRKN